MAGPYRPGDAMNSEPSVRPRGGAEGEEVSMSTAAVRRPRVLLGGLAYVESPRWHEGRLWFSHWGAEEIVAVDLEGRSEVVGQGPPGLGWAAEWLPDGRRLLTGQRLLRQEPDGTMVENADLSAISTHGWSEIVVDGRGNVYVNSIGFDFMAGAEPGAGVIALIRPDRSVQQLAGDLEFPNGMVVTPDNSTLIVSESFASRLTAFDIAADGSLSRRRVWAEGIGPDGICLDAEGCIWTHSALTSECVRVREGGEVLDRIPIDRLLFATMLGGPDRRTLFMLVAEWHGTENVDEVIARRSAQVLVADVDVPGVGWP
jgi:sugar lactone lactonase YvrE